MFTTGSKFLIGASVVAVLSAVVYGIGQGGVMGTVGLSSAAAGLIGLTTLNLFLRDSNFFADDEAPVESAAAAQYAPSASVWPLGFAFAAVVMAVGLVSYQPILVIGLIALLAAGTEWTVQAWSERASGNVEHNAAVRSRLSNPLEYPVGSIIAAGVVIYGFSRVMLWLSKTNTVVAFAVLATVVVAVAFVLSFGRTIKTGAMGGILAVGAIAMIAAGTLTGLDGERDIPVFETTAIWQEEGILHAEKYAEGAEKGKHPADLICESPEAFPEADKKASQTVAAKSGTFQVFLRENGSLDYDVPGNLPEGSDAITLIRSNPSNVIFRNESNEEARLTLDLGTETFEVEEGEETIGIEARNQVCTTLIEPGAAQIFTLEVDQPSFAFADVENPNGDGGDGFYFFVPGIEAATLQVIVP
ncbi:MAG: hypothetical protein ACI8V4_000716 [Ilumatobacter sp.]|jgi:hypothetical protein